MCTTPLAKQVCGLGYCLLATKREEKNGVFVMPNEVYERNETPRRGSNKEDDGIKGVCSAGYGARAMQFFL